MERPTDREVPDPQSFDPAGSDAPALPPAADGSPGVVLLMVDPAAREDDWAEHAAAALATGWADQGRRILLADLALARPGLHRVLDVGNGEGVSDAFLFGSSMKRVARPVRDGRFLFMPAGTATARPQDVTSSPRWASIIAACASVRATLVAFLPSDLPGAEALLRWGTDVLLLTDPAAMRHEALAQGLGDRLRGILTPPNGRTEDEVPVATSAEPASTDAEEWTQPPDVPEEAALPSVDSGAGLAAAWQPAAEEPPDPGHALPLLDHAPEEPEPTTVDRWAETEPEHQRATEGGGESLVADAGLEIELGEAAEISAPAWAEATAPPDPTGALDFADVQASPDLLMPEPVIPEQEQTAAAFDLSSFDGLVEPAEPPARAPAILESEEPPIGGDAPPPHEQLLAGEEVGGFGLVGAVEPAPAPEPAVPARRAAPVERPKPAPRPAAKPAPQPAVQHATGSLVGAILIAALLVAVALAWFDVVEIPWLSDFLDARRAQPVSSAPAPAELAPPGTAPGVLGASLALGAFTDAPVARLQAEALSRQRPDLLFVVAPVATEGVVHHRLLAGPARDSAEAATLRERLGTLLTREDPRSWPTLSTPLAFSLGETDDLRAARVRVDALSRVDIPAYVLELPAPTGFTGEARGAGPFVQVRSTDDGARYRVYAGAYANAHEAAHLAELLARQGESRAPLIERTGRHIE